MTKTQQYLEKLCQFYAPSGMEGDLTSYIKSQIEPYCKECYIDALGNLIAFKEGKNRAVKRVQVDAHTDEVGMIITAINSDGSLCFSAIGGINCDSLVSKRVIFGDVIGVIQTKPVHLLDAAQKSKLPDKSSLTIDIGATSAEDAKQFVSVGDIGTFYSKYETLGEDCLLARALDDRVGCAVLMTLITEEQPYDAYYTFCVQEEVGCRGARTAAYGINPDIALVLETTTAADIPDVPDNKSVCHLGDGAVVCFMDNGTIYDRKLYNAAFEIASQKGIKAQPKASVSGGNDSSAIHQAREGVRTLALSTPCRYLHSSACLIKLEDMEAQLALTRELLSLCASGKV